MKKTIALFLLVFMVFGTAFPVSLDDKVTYLSNKRWYFDGFSFDGYNPVQDNGGLRPRIEAEANKIKNYPYEPGETFGFVGHSQGALRALAVATYLKNNEPETYNKLDYVITISGIDRGLKALEGGLPYFKSKILRDYTTLRFGIQSCFSAFGPFGTIPFHLLTSRDPYFSIIGGYYTGIASFFAGDHFTKDYLPDNPGDFLSSYFPQILNDYVYLAYAYSGREHLLQEINDMVPGSTFITENVVVSDYKTRTAKMLTGYKSVLRLGWKHIFLFIYIPYLYWARVPQYTYITIYDGSETMRLGEELPIGYIAGLNSDSFSMMDPAQREEVAAFRKVSIGILDTAAKIHIGKSLMIFGLFIGAPAQYDDAIDAMNYLKNLEGNLNNLKGEDKNDGLVALGSQYYPRAIHDNILLAVPDRQKSFEGMPQHNHKSISYRDNMPADTEARIRDMLANVTNQRRR